MKKNKIISALSFWAFWGGISTVSANEIFLSEYIEGSGLNKAVELYNPSDQPIDLSNYQLKIYFNGSTSAGKVIALGGTIAPQSTYVIASTDGVDDLTSRADQLAGGGWFNGDDTLILFNGSNIIDRIGQLGVDPGSRWGTGDITTQNHTLRRIDSITAGETDPNAAFDPAQQWLGFASDTFDGLGSHGDGTTPPPPPPPSDVCGDSYTKIHSIQGDGSSSPMVNQQVTIEAIVTADHQTGLKGLFVQSFPIDDDGFNSTSEGVFLYTASSPLAVNVGDVIRVTASVAEYYETTQLTNVVASQVCGTNHQLPISSMVSLPANAVDDWEQFEGMLVHFEQNLIVNEVHNLGRYGQFYLGSQRHFAPTQVALPGTAAQEVAQQNSLDSLLVDDGLTQQNPETVIFPAPQLSASNTLRNGDTVSSLAGVIHYSFGKYQLLPSGPIIHSMTNTRLSEPELALGNLKVASFNVLNFFNGDGNGGGFPTARGADSASELMRQKAKIVTAIIALDADIIGLMEIENDGFGRQSAIAELVNTLNNSTGSDAYQFIGDGNGIGNDQIAVGIIYRQDRVSPVGLPKLLSSANSPVDDSNSPLFNSDKNRVMITQMFTLANSESFAIAVNHLKSKGSSCSSIGDPDNNDGQGNCNLTRTRAAQGISQWLSEQYPATKLLIVGDINAYAKEDPITTFANEGFSELSSAMGKLDAYSYVYRGGAGQLDHALANHEMLAAVVDVTTWHINTDEPRALDYNEEFKSSDQLISWYNDDAYRSSDHDPVVVSIALMPVNIAPSSAFQYTQNHALVNFISISDDPDGSIVDWKWNFGDGINGSSETTSHQYDASGIYTVTLTVTDNDNATATSSQQITVNIAVTDLELTIKRAYKSRRGTLKVFLQWQGSANDDVEIYRNDRLITVTRNNGRFIDRARNQQASEFVYKICEVDGPCSAEQVVNFNNN
ncbi:MAG: ExeM/NucH family extracellular endonuclease [Gammaproteobacteria bacterium]|nr:ExeM/NucH family extracellular endonuclease [Gammaproteobacteria bacterium]